MKLGFITSICEGMTFEEVVDFAAENGLECLEVACWPNFGAKRRYAGVSHIDVAALTPEKTEEIKALCASRGVEISSLCYYPNTMDPDLEKRQSYIDHIYKLIDASAMLDVNMITTFVGRVPDKTFAENLEIFKEVWPPIVKYAEEKGVKIGIENCPMLFTDDEWPGGQNIMTTPANWRKIFEIIDSPNLVLTMTRPILSGSRLTILNQFTSLRIKSSMFITRILRFIRTSWLMLERWLHHCSTCLRSFRGLATLTGENMYQL